jgi:hypothetical protein
MKTTKLPTIQTFNLLNDKNNKIKETKIENLPLLNELKKIKPKSTNISSNNKIFADK